MKIFKTKHSAVVGLSLLSAIVSAGETPPKKTVRVALAPEYKAGWIHRVFLGDHWRDLWTTQFDIPILDLKKFGGGLTPLRRGGGMQSKGIRFQGKDGKQYKFRTINKDPTKRMPPELADSLLGDILQDQVSCFNPVASLVVDPIASALNVVQTKPIVVMLPDDPKLGEFRSAFKGLIGTIEENPTVYDDGDSTVENADKIVSTIKLYKRLERSGKENVDVKAFLRARLLDIFLGDPDRHHKQWRWARIDDGERRTWVPIARDRDQAFARYDGFFPWMSTLIMRQLNGATESYPRMEALTWSGRHLDRRLLSRLSREEWDEVTTEVLSKLTDRVIVRAVHEMPPEMYEKEGAKLEKVLKARRDKLRDASDEFYKLLAAYVDIRGTEEDDLVKVNRLDDHRTKVAIYRVKDSGEVASVPYFTRTFNDKDTKTLRLFLLGGKDKILYEGQSSNSISLDIYPEGDNYLPTAKTDEEKYEPPMDYGHDFWFQPLFKASSDEGVLLGGGPVIYKHGVHQFPYVYREQIRAGFAFGSNKFYFDFNGDYLSALSPARLVVDAKATELDVQNYYGLGNYSPRDSGQESKGYYKARQRLYEIAPRVEFPKSKSKTLVAYVGPSFKFSKIDDTDQNTLVGLTRPAGIDTNMILGGTLGIRVDTRDTPVFASKGVYANLATDLFPKSLDNPYTYGKLRGEARAYATWHLITDTTLSFRAGGERFWGTHPFYDSAFIGGDSTVRGFRRNRYGGDASVFGGAELKLFLARLKLLFPARTGVLGFVDAGRVFMNVDDYRILSQLHKGFGGGIWSSFAYPDYTLVATYAKSSDQFIISVKLGSAF